MTKVRHVLGISGGKDSAALAIYLFNKYSEIDMEYYFCDTGKELDETYELVSKLENLLGKTITKIEAAHESHLDPFDHYYEIFGGYLPSSQARWCTKKLKLEPFEKFVGDDPVISYVGIRGDEDREGYISRKPNIQSIFPFRQNIWSQDVIKQVLQNSHIEAFFDYYLNNIEAGVKDRALEIIDRRLSASFTAEEKLKLLLDIDTPTFNQVAFNLLKNTNYPIAQLNSFPLIDNEDILVRDDIFRTLRESGVGVPAYYEELDFEIDGQIGKYARSRSGCFFCFFQQKIEWVWLLENHPDRFQKAMAYEKDGFTWMEESLEDLAEPERVAEIKREFLKKLNNQKSNSPLLIDKLDDGEGCAACFI
jgi:3'-phosphoadenosine 5'-phosphosulfate sulfotransferase (PAPS reductase)/FAD synthetase